MDIPYTVQPRPDTGLFNAKVGIWLFLASEVMLFGALFSSYILLRVGADPANWPHGLLNIPIGTFNTGLIYNQLVGNPAVRFDLGKMSSGTWSTFSTVPYAVSPTTFYRVAFTVNGSALTCTVTETASNRTATVSASATDFGSGAIGAAASGNAEFDNFSVVSV